MQVVIGKLKYKNASANSDSEIKNASGNRDIKYACGNRNTKIKKCKC